MACLTHLCWYRHIVLLIQFDLSDRAPNLSRRGHQLCCDRDDHKEDRSTSPQSAHFLSNTATRPVNPRFRSGSRRPLPVGRRGRRAPRSERRPELLCAPTGWLTRCCVDAPSSQYEPKSTILRGHRMQTHWSDLDMDDSPPQTEGLPRPVQNWRMSTEPIRRTAEGPESNANCRSTPDDPTDASRPDGPDQSDFVRNWLVSMYSPVSNRAAIRANRANMSQ
jgi:hypothetical protein